ncbi:MAG: alpha/beta hydrolase [Blastocatellia bacterium]
MNQLTRSLTIVIFITSVFAGNQALAARPVDRESHYAKLDGHRIHYENHGKGREALVFVHGWTCNLEFWNRQTPAFESKTRVLLIDLPGHGQSDKPQIAYSMDLYARAVDAVLADAGVDRAVLVGHSMGTPVIREFYRKYPRKTLGLVIVDGPLRPFADQKAMEQFIVPMRGPNYKEVASGFIAAIIGQSATPELRAEIKDAMLSTPQHVAVSAMEGMNDPGIWKDDKINVPALAVMTKAWPPDTEQFYRSLAPKLAYHPMDGVGHFLMMEKPAEFNELLAGFLAQNGFLKKQ